MASITLYIPGAERPEQISQAKRLQQIRARVAASQNVVDLLCELAYGPRLDPTWPAAIHTSFAEAAHG